MKNNIQLMMENTIQFLEKAKKSDLINIIGIIRKDWERADFLESYQDEWESVPKKTEDCKEQMIDYLYNTYDKNLLYSMIMDYRYDDRLIEAITTVSGKQ